MKKTLKHKTSIANMFMINKYKNEADFYKSIDFESQVYIINKESLKAMFELFHEFSVSDYIENIDNIALCLNLIQFAAKVEIDSDNSL